MEKYFPAGQEKHVESSSFFDIKSGKNRRNIKQKVFNKEEKVEEK
jgi:hypothetical protein